MKTSQIRLRTFGGVVAKHASIVALAAFFTAAPLHPAFAQTAPTLGTAQSYAVLGGQTVTNTGPTIITGDLGVSPGTAVTGGPFVSGTIHTGADPVAIAAESANTAAYLNLAGQGCPATNNLTGQDLGLMPASGLVPGVYCFSSSAQLTGTLKLNGGGDPNAVWIFQMGSTLTTASSSTVEMIGGGQDCNVFWQVGSSATIGTSTTFIGNILALTDIGLFTNATVSGRALARNGQVTMDSNKVTPSACAVAAVPPTLSKSFSPASIDANGLSMLTITLNNVDSAVASLSAPLVDTLPSGMTVAGIADTTCGGAFTLAATPGSATVSLSGASISASGSCSVTVPVTASVAGSYRNTLPVGALSTDKGSNAVGAAATLTVLPATNIAPGLSLTKTANRTTYTAVGQVIVYTYLLQNTGNVALSGPFTVTDDKLGAFACGTAASLAPGASVTCTKNYTIKASDLGTGTILPTGVSAKVNTGIWLAGVKSTQDTKISGAGAGVPNGIYPGWCIQDHVPTDLHNQRAKLYSTIGSGLPADVAGLPWGKVNYMLNHKIRGAGKANYAFYKDVQTAVWVLLGEAHPTFGVSASAQQMIDAANANASFVPGPDDVVAVIIYSDGMTVTPGSIQESIVEMKQPKAGVLKSIVNLATGSATFGGSVLQSGQVQATVNQVR